MANLVGKTINMSLVGMDGNAYSIMGNFSKQAKREGWTKEEIDKVLTECQSGDYDHLIITMLEYTNVDEFELEEDDDEEDGDFYSNEFGGAY